MKIAVAAQGRFHAFDLVKALLKRGHQVIVLTNYPAWAARKFGLPPTAVRSFWIHAIVARVLYKFSKAGLRWDISALLNPAFGRWTASQLRKDRYDVVHSFSGIAVEQLRDAAKHPDHERPVHLVVRGSSHIAVQDALLHEEELRANRKIERPSRVVMEREGMEYRCADRIVILSTFAYDSFVSQGIDKKRLALLPLGVNVDDFRASEEVLQARCDRILSGEPLRVLWVGTMSLRKGVLDYVQIVRALARQNFRFRFVGDIPGDLRPVAAEISDIVEFLPRQKQWTLRQQYGWADVFVFPTIEDGFAVVLTQAAANGLPILATTNCAAPDMIRENATGWVLPIRSPQLFIERLRWCHQNRPAVATMVRRISKEFVPRTWDNVAQDFENICKDAIQSRKGTNACR